MYIPRLNHKERVDKLTEQVIEASYRMDAARQEYEAALVVLALAVQEMQSANYVRHKRLAARSDARQIRKQICTMRKAS